MLAEKILLPLGLTNAFFAAHEGLPTGTVRGYDVSLLGTGRLAIKKDMEGLWIPFETSAFTAGAVTASASDVARFTYSLLERRLLGEGSIQSMLTFVDAPDTDVPEQSGYGLRVRRLEIGGDQLVGHTGVFPGFSNVAAHSPRNGYAISVNDDPIVAAKGEMVTVDRADPDWPGWLWCTTRQGKSGWVSARVLRRVGSEAVLLDDFSALELTVDVGEVVQGSRVLDGWVWCRKHDGGEGWVPGKTYGS